MTSYYVATNGSDSNDGALSSPFLTIDKGIRSASTGDTVFIREGEYNESIWITKGEENKNYLIIKAYSNETPIIIPRVVSSGWGGIGNNKWTITLSKSDYLFSVSDDLNTYSPALIKKDGRGITRVNSVAELTDTGLNITDPSIVGTNPSAEYSLFFSEEDDSSIYITLFLPDGKNPNENNIYIVDSTDIIDVSSPNIEINGLTIKYSYQGISVSDDNNPSVPLEFQTYFYPRILNNIIERTAFHGINNLKDGAYIYNNTIKYCGAELKYNVANPSYLLDVNDLINCIYTIGDNSEIIGNTLEKSYGVELYCLDKDFLSLSNNSSRKPIYNIIKNNFVKGQVLISGSDNSIYNNIFVDDTDSTINDYVFELYTSYDTYVYNNLFIGYKGIKIRTDGQNTEYLEFINNIVKTLSSGGLILELLINSSNIKISNNIYYGSSNFYVDGLSFVDYDEYIDYMNNNNLEIGSINTEPIFSNTDTNPDNYTDLGFYPGENSSQISNGISSNGISRRQLKSFVDSSSQELWVDYVNGDDSNDGSENSPFQTFDYILTQIISGTSVDGRSVIHVKSGIHTLNPSTISYKNYVDIVFEENVILNDGGGAGHDVSFGSDSLFFRILNCNYIRVIGNYTVIDMTYEYYELFGINPQTHAIAIHSSNNVLIQSIRIAETGADGLYIGGASSGDNYFCENIEVYDFVVEKSRRGGVNPFTIDGLIGRRWFLKDAIGQGSKVAIDFEPNSYPPTQRLDDIDIKNVWMENIGTHGISTKIPQGSFDPANPSVILPGSNISLTNFYMDGKLQSNMRGISIGTILGKGERIDWKAIIDKGFDNDSGKCWFKIEDDFTGLSALSQGRYVEVHGSQNNNGLYSIDSASYDNGEDATTVFVNEKINDMNPSIVDGYLEIRITEEFSNDINFIYDKFTIKNCGRSGFNGALYAENKNIILRNSIISNVRTSDETNLLSPIFFDSTIGGGGEYGDVTLDNVYIEDDQDRPVCCFDWQGSVYKYDVETIDFENNKFTIGRDLTYLNIFELPPTSSSQNEPGRVIRIYGSTNKDGIYTISNSEVFGERTVFTVLEDIPQDIDPSGDDYGKLYYGAQPLVNCHGKIYAKNSELTGEVIDFEQESDNFNVDMTGEKTDVVPDSIGFSRYEVSENNFLTNVSNPYLPSALDYSGTNRVLDGEIVDIGPFEYLVTADTSLTGFTLWYKTVSDLINNAQLRGVDISYFINNTNITLSNSGISSENINRQKLSDQIDSTYDIMVNRHQSYTEHMKNFVFVLQKYVDDNYTSVNDFLSDNDIQVKPVFADISNVVGYPIDLANIETVS